MKAKLVLLLQNAAIALCLLALTDLAKPAFAQEQSKASLAPPAASAKSITQQAQQRLLALGYQPGPADGAMGAKAIAAVSKFQADHALPVTGVLDRRTLEALKVTAAHTPAEKPSRAAAATSAAAKPAAKAGTLAAFPDLVEGKLIMARQFTMNGLAEPSLWIKSDNAKYEVVLTEKTSIPVEWRPEGGDDKRYPVTIDSIELHVLPEGLHVTPNQDGTASITLNSNSAMTDRHGYIMSAYPLVGRYSLRGKVDADTGTITVGEVKYLGVAP